MNMGFQEQPGVKNFMDMIAQLSNPTASTPGGNLLQGNVNSFMSSNMENLGGNQVPGGGQYNANFTDLFGQASDSLAQGTATMDADRQSNLYKSIASLMEAGFKNRQLDIQETGQSNDLWGSILGGAGSGLGMLLGGPLGGLFGGQLGGLAEGSNPMGALNSTNPQANSYGKIGQANNGLFGIGYK